MSVAGCSDDFVWTYHPGTDLKHTLRYPDGSLVTWEYEPNRANVTVVSNDVYSLFMYMYDSAGRRIVANDDRYAYNCRDELTSVSNINSGVMFSYVYDDIGNRIRSQEPSVSCEYFVNELNQYTNVIRNGVFDVPKFDLDGNQTNIVTSTGEWAVEYNAENRPIKWVRKTMSDGSIITNQTVVTMSYDCLGRRVWKNDKNFLYDNYLNITQTIWDPTEPVATVPIVWKEQKAGADEIIFLFHDVNKNVVTTKGTGLKAYSYNPYGPMNVVTNDQMPWQYSSEYCDNSWEDDVGLVYYNFREYSPADGRWMTFDKNGDSMDKNLLLFVGNSPLLGFDILGNDGCYKYGDPYIVETETEAGGWTPWRNRTTLTEYWVDERAYPFILTPWGFSGGLLLKIQRCACVYNRFEEKERVITKKVHKKQKYRCVFGCPEVSMTYDEDLGWSEEISSEKDVRGISSRDPIYLSPLRRSGGEPDCYLTCILNIMN
jgi:RHS repeat-associated protein